LSNENIKIREHPEEGVYLEGVEVIQVHNFNDCMNILKLGDKNRHTTATE